MKVGVWTTVVLGVVLVVGGSGMFSQRLRAQEGAVGPVVLVEVQWDGVEYVRLANIGSEPVDLTGWILRRQRRADEAAVDVAELSDVLLNAGGEVVVSRAVDDEAIVAKSLVLHNDGDVLELADATGAVVDVVGHYGPWFAGQNTEAGVPMVRIDWEVAGTEADNWEDGEPVAAEVDEATASPPASGTISPGNEEEIIDEGGDERVLSMEQVRQSLRISEVLPNPVGPDGEGEFVELFNRGEVAIDVTGWQLDDIEGGSRPHVIVEGVIAPGSYRVWPRAESGVAYNNDGDAVRLLNPAGEVALEVTYGKEAKEGWSWNWVNGVYMVSSQPTPGAVNVLVQPSQRSSAPAGQASNSSEKSEEATEEDVDYSDELVVYSFLPNPEGVDGEGEYIELENTGEVPVRLRGWQLDDMEGGSRPYSFEDEVLEAGERRRFIRALTNLALNNNGDEVRLIDPAGKVVSAASYETVGEGEVFYLQEGGQYAAAEEDGEVLAAQVEVLTVAQARLAEDDVEVMVEGVVIAPPGVLGSRVMYVADEDGVGLQVYSSRQWPELRWWQRVRVTGVLGQAYGERRLRVAVDGVEVTGEGAEVVPTDILTGEVVEAWEGQLVRIEGAVAQASGSTLYVDDGSGEVRVVVKPEAGIDKPRMRQGMMVQVVGVVSETQSGYRILPRRQDDFVVAGRVAGAVENESRSGPELPSNNSVLLGATEDMPLPRVELPDNPVDEHQSWLDVESKQRTRETTRNTIVLVGLGLAAVQLVGGAREGEPLWKGKE